MIKNVIFSGGGFKGWAFIGTIRALNDYIKFNELESITGTSVGSVYGLFYLLNIDWKILLDSIMNLDYPSMIDLDMDNFLVNQSILKGIKFKEYLMEMISL